MDAAVSASKDRMTSLSSVGTGSEMGNVSSTTSEYAFDASRLNLRAIQTTMLARGFLADV